MVDYLDSINTGNSLSRTGGLEKAAGAGNEKNKADALNKIDPAKDKELRDACQNFESLFLYYLLKDMRKTVHKSELFSGGQGEEMFQGLLDMNYAEKASRHGDGMGIAKMLYDSFQKKMLPTVYSQTKKGGE